MEGTTGRGHKHVAALSWSAEGFPYPALSTPQLAVFRGRHFPCQLADLRGWGRALAAAEAFALGLAAGVAAPLGSVVGWTLG